MFASGHAFDSVGIRRGHDSALRHTLDVSCGTSLPQVMWARSTLLQQEDLVRFVLVFAERIRGRSWKHARAAYELKHGSAENMCSHWKMHFCRLVTR
eukprot:2282399-Amphidinium_carterae.1